LLACEEVVHAQVSVVVIGVAVVDGDAAARGLEGQRYRIAAGEAEAEYSAERTVVEDFRARGLVRDEVEWALGREVGWLRRDQSPVGAAAGAEREEILEARQAASGQRDQLG
jgi:hypothetical protein